MDTRVIRDELDLVAEKLESKGWQDLADKVDYYGSRLVQASTDRQIDVIRVALERINHEADRRLGIRGTGDRSNHRESIRDRVEARKREMRKREALRRLKARHARSRSGRHDDGDDRSSSRSLRAARMMRLRRNRRD